MGALATCDASTGLVTTGSVQVRAGILQKGRKKRINEEHKLANSCGVAKQRELGSAVSQNLVIREVQTYLRPSSALSTTLSTTSTRAIAATTTAMNKSKLKSICHMLIYYMTNHFPGNIPVNDSERQTALPTAISHARTDALQSIDRGEDLSTGMFLF